MRFVHGFVGARIGIKLLPLSSRFVDVPDRLAKSAIQSGCLTELLRQLPQQTLALQIAACLRDLMIQYFWKTKMLEERHYVRECLVEGELIPIARRKVFWQRSV